MYSPAATITSKLESALDFPPGEFIALGLVCDDVGVMKKQATLCVDELDVGKVIPSNTSSSSSSLHSSLRSPPLPPSPPLYPLPENLNLSIISGSLSLTSSSLKPSLLSSTSYILVSSHIGTITASIPWRTLIFSNASIQISDVTIVLAVKGTSGGERRREERERMQEEIRRAEEYFREGREDVQEIAEEITREKAR